MSTTQYSTTFRINPATAAKAFSELVDEGVLFRQRGVGMFVTTGAPDRLRTRRRKAIFTDRVDPVLRDAEVLGINAADLTAYIHEHHQSTPTPTSKEPAR